MEFYRGDYKTFCAERRKARHAAFLTAIARAYVLVDARAHQRRDGVKLVWSEDLGYPDPPTECQMRYAGAPKAAIARLRQGNLGIESKLGCWTGEFLLGLKLSGALAEKEPGRYRIDSKLHPQLIGDIQNWILAGRLGSPDRDGRRRLIACPAVTHLPADDPQGASVMAGLFAGARLSLIGGEQWLVLPDEEPIRQLLKDWTILHYPFRCIQRRSYIKVSPFSAPLFADLMPGQSRDRILRIRKPAMCPLLPITYWELGFSLLKTGRRVLPFADALPFGISRRTFFRQGWRRRELHRKAVQELGILSVDARLRSRMEQWFERHEQERSDHRKDSN